MAFKMAFLECPHGGLQAFYGSQVMRTKLTSKSYVVYIWSHNSQKIWGDETYAVHREYPKSWGDLKRLGSNAPNQPQTLKPHHSVHYKSFVAPDVATKPPYGVGLCNDLELFESFVRRYTIVTACPRGRNPSEIDFQCSVRPSRKADVRLPGKENSNSQGARPVHLIITKV